MDAARAPGWGRVHGASGGGGGPGAGLCPSPLLLTPLTHLSPAPLSAAQPSLQPLKSPPGSRARFPQMSVWDSSLPSTNFQTKTDCRRALNPGFATKCVFSHGWQRSSGWSVPRHRAATQVPLSLHCPKAGLGPVCICPRTDKLSGMRKTWGGGCQSPPLSAWLSPTAACLPAGTRRREPGEPEGPQQSQISARRG